MNCRLDSKKMDWLALTGVLLSLSALFLFFACLLWLLPIAVDVVAMLSALAGIICGSVAIGLKKKSEYTSTTFVVMAIILGLPALYALVTLFAMYLNRCVWGN